MYGVVVYQGIIREKPTSEKEAREFIKGLIWLCFCFICTHARNIHKFK
ncbi:hypothetical protein Ahy_A08g040436 isoform B [Arachis hypogaea]|uniref:Uncharacterized protein n=1 Tax=Arachis hypogaea TaxID=3818 RepID=A0A445BZ75_ARAHY|nr:hypothetical protein Ahy_A08g040436 isoform B [Arachis hypogaea]